MMIFHSYVSLPEGTGKIGDGLLMGTMVTISCDMFGGCGNAMTIHDWNCELQAQNRLCKFLPKSWDLKQSG